MTGDKPKESAVLESRLPPSLTDQLEGASMPPVRVLNRRPAKPLYTADQVDRWVIEFFCLIAHGDEKHRAGLAEVFEEFWDVKIPETAVLGAVKGALKNNIKEK